MKKNTALVIIDVQIGAFDGKKISPIENEEEFINTLKALLNLFRKNGLLVVFIQDCGDVGGAFEQHSEHWPIHSSIKPKREEITILKQGGDAFFDTELKEVLKQHSINELVLTGLHSEKCVTETFLEAIDEDYHVLVPENGHTTISSKNRNFRNIINTQNDFFVNKGGHVIAMMELNDLIANKALSIL